MFNKVRIQKIENSNKCIVQAISIKKNEAELLIPSPFGAETMIFEDIDNAIKAIKQSGYEYCIVKSIKDSIPNKIEAVESEVNYSKIIEVFVKNLGHENLEIRNSAINSLAKFGMEISSRLIEILQGNSSWLVQQSVIKCIEKIISENNSSAILFTEPLIQISETDNTMVKSAALKALEKICDIKNNQ